MKNVLILHGEKGNSKGNWFPWLKKELEQKEYAVWVPDLPDAEKPNLATWKEHIFARKDWELNKESIIIGHSSGATFMLGLLESLPKNVRIEKAILVSPYIELEERTDLLKYKNDLLKVFDWKKIQHSCRRFYFIVSDNDPYFYGADQGQILQDRLGGEVVTLAAEGHFNLDKGDKYKQFPELLKYF